MIRQDDIFVKGQTSSLAWMDELEEVEARIRELEYLLADIEEAPEEYEDVDKGAYEAELQDLERRQEDLLEEDERFTQECLDEMRYDYWASR